MIVGVAVNSYDLGDQVRLSAVFTDADGVTVEPTVITVKYSDPTGDVTELTYGVDVAVTQEAAGSYYVDFVPSRAGQWRYRWESSGTVTAAAEGVFQVKRSSF